jgi:hypothetical protein
MRLRYLVPAALTVLLLTSPVAVADGGDGHGTGKPDLVPVHRLDGASGGKLLGQWWAEVLAYPAANNPITGGDPVCMALGKHGRVLAGAASVPTHTCTMRAGTDLFVPVSSAECSSAEPPPFFGLTEEEQQACAIDFAFADDFVTAIKLSLDGGPIVDIHRRSYQVVSPQLTTVFPPGPIFDAIPGPATFAAAGYAATPRRALRPGRHVIDGEVVLPDGTSFEFEFAVEVVRRRH